VANGSHNQHSKVRESPRDWRILRFLKRAPRPAKLVGELDDGEEMTVAVNSKPGNAGAVLWLDAVAALHPCVKITALDKDGAILRVLPLDPNDPELEAEAQREESRAERNTRGRVSVPIISVDVPKLVDNIARNMKEASISGATHQANAFKEGFAAMTSVVNLCLTILMRVDARLEQAEASAGTVVETPGQPSMRDQMVMMALQKAMGGGPVPAQGITLDPNMIASIVAQFQQQTPSSESNGHG